MVGPPGLIIGARTRKVPDRRTPGFRRRKTARRRRQGHLRNKAHRSHYGLFELKQTSRALYGTPATRHGLTLYYQCRDYAPLRSRSPRLVLSNHGSKPLSQRSSPHRAYSSERRTAISAIAAGGSCITRARFRSTDSLPIAPPSVDHECLPASLTRLLEVARSVSGSARRSPRPGAKRE